MSHPSHNNSTAGGFPQGMQIFAAIVFYKGQGVQPGGEDHSWRQELLAAGCICLS